MIPTILKGVPAQAVPEIWPHVARLIEIGLARLGGRYTVPQIKLDLIARDKQLWMALDKETGDLEGLCITEILTYPSGLKKCNVFLLTGRERARWLAYAPVIEAWAEAEGCSGIEAWARKGWEADFPAYKITRILLEKDFGRQ